MPRHQKNPSRREIRLMHLHLKWFFNEAHLVRELRKESTARSGPDAWQSAALRILETAMPLLLLIRLYAFLEDVLDRLISRAVPELDKARLRFEDKLSIVNRLHGIDVARFKRLQKARNLSAHDAMATITWDDFSSYFGGVALFVIRLDEKTKRPRRKGLTMKDLNLPKTS